MIADAHATLEGALASGGVRFDDIMLDRVYPRHKGELVGFNVTVPGLNDSVQVFVDSGIAPVTSFSEHVMFATDSNTGVERRVWAFPHDPDLPGLAQLLEPATREQTLLRLGFRGGGENLFVEYYEPGIRAVLRMDGGENPAQTRGPQIRLLVVTPGRTDLVRQVTRDFLQAGVLVPRVLSHDPVGILVTDIPYAVPLRSVLPDILGDTEFHEQLDHTLRAASAVSTRIKALAGPLERVGWYTAVMGELRQDWDARLNAIGQKISTSLRSLDIDRSRHGNFTIDSIMVHHDAPHELLCVRAVDGAGIGFISADNAVFYADLLIRSIRTKAKGDEAANLMVSVYADQVRAFLHPHPAATAAHLLAAALTHVTKESNEDQQVADALVKAADVLVS